MVVGVEEARAASSRAVSSCSLGSELCRSSMLCLLASFCFTSICRRRRRRRRRGKRSSCSFMPSYSCAAIRDTADS
ncbi:hypothetical protein EYF80_028709 [Liparis tanakae]|uniref:Uncharacterized protein n=1 Tax=Liparis tanakae TaxID=230148 RepID=A0A4Z2H5P9_9TELE|nr:hypothetical protein EYF80_028709 [Liparis tanakae]